MATLTITIPDSIDDIPSALAQLQKQLMAVNAQREGLLGAIKAIQKQCPHTNMRHSNGYGGSSSYCPTCEYRD